MNIKIIKHLLIRTMHNPHYFSYFVRNAFDYYMRNYFPSVYSRYKFKSLDLGDVAGLKQLHVIIRTTDQVMNINAARHLEEIGITTRNDVIRMGGCTLFKAGEAFAKTFGKEHLKITIVADQLSEQGLAQYRDAAIASGLSFDRVHAKDHGNGPSFQTQIDIALQDSDDTLALILEDDYLLEDESFTTCFRIMRNHANVIGMNPHFHPDRVRRQDIGKMVTINSRLYSRIFNTCCTFFMPVRVMKRYEKFLRIYEGCEDGSINCIWKRGICLGPLGWTMAEALHRSELSPVNTLLEHDT